jgi:hypothetical protein
MPAKMLGLQMDFLYGAIVEDRRYALHKELGEPVSVDMLLKERTCSTGGGGT